MALTGIKDVDLEILNNLDDRSLLNFCSTNKANKQLCDNEMFWKKRFIKRFSEKASEYKPINRTWKNYYMRVVIDLDKFSKDPWAFLKHIQWSPEAKDSFFVDEDGKKISFFKSPEWVMNNFYLLEISNFQYNGVKYPTITPSELFNIIITSESFRGSIIYAFKALFSY